MKKYSVTLGAESLDLKYRISDREAVEDMFPRADGSPGSFGGLMNAHLIRNGGAFKVQSAFLWAGLNYIGSKWTQEKVHDEFAKQITTGEGLRDINTAMVKAILASGVLGQVIQDDAEDEPGKEQPPAA